MGAPRGKQLIGEKRKEKMEKRVPIDAEAVAYCEADSENAKRIANTVHGVGRGEPMVVNEAGGKQSKVHYRFDLLDPRAMFEMTKVLKEGADKYGEDNWRKIPVSDHLNHMIIHAYAYLAGDKSDDHLSHIMCRAMFAQGVGIDELDHSDDYAESLDQPLHDMFLNCGHCGVKLVYKIEGVSKCIACNGHNQVRLNNGTVQSWIVVPIADSTSSSSSVWDKMIHD